ncbi:Putative oxidoreductase SadH [Zhongshania aliphaticivorans]|uniref:Oxidoreductase SadH n=1 Tax=Zhongshania aliphaticivorans TaxID=1470434 RepID=A0A5S9QU16_9GAMM|nr:SDR family oxidoreductase [Zhongshania aliphaticivorans]CAA0110096.1 Putative oxidoreductase SadH [Zhongshania aliphaticivorans]CAA0117994.1 Putative oxidoreductase SadH [Zhongshania aliphaticivorans]CAA0121873.1 Putative oxidoreductase SadH [Zhongshania aliphaticivorans]
MKTFKDKIAIVTGGGGNGIGHHLVMALAQRGATVAFCDISKREITEEKLEQLGVDFYSEHVNMGDKDAINVFIDNVLKRYKHIDLLINNAGIALGDLTFGEASEADFEKITNINYWGVIHTTQRCYQYLLSRPEAAIVNLSSSQGILALPYLVPYCTTKFAVRGFTDSLRAEHRIRGIRNLTLHTVHPGAVATNITLNADYHNSGTGHFHEELQKGTTPTEAANIILHGVQKNIRGVFLLAMGGCKIYWRV